MLERELEGMDEDQVKGKKVRSDDGRDSKGHVTSESDELSDMDTDELEKLLA